MEQNESFFRRLRFTRGGDVIVKVNQIQSQCQYLNPWMPAALDDRVDHRDAPNDLSQVEICWHCHSKII